MPKSRVTLWGSFRQPFPGVEKIGPADESANIYVTVYVRRKSKPPPLTQSGVYMKHDAYVAAHGANADDFLAVRDFAKEYHLEPRNENAAKRSIELHGTVGDLGRAFGVQLEHGRINGEIHRIREGEITLPEDLSGIVLDVAGLDDRPVAKPHFMKREELDNAGAAAAAQPLTALAVAQLYDFPPGLDGAGQTIAIIELDGGFQQSDLDTYFKGLGLSSPSIAAVVLQGGENLMNKNLPDNPLLNADAEVALDIQVAGAVAPGAAQLVYFAPNTNQGFLDAITSAIHATPAPAAISISWGDPEANFPDMSKNSFDQAFQDAANLGIPVCVATGDNASFDGTSALEVDFPASAPHALACGGTNLAVSGNVISGETVWNSGGGRGTGGGVSQFFPKPAYQSSVLVPGSPAGSAGGRGLPDVCGDADPATGYKIHYTNTENAGDIVVGGTSAVAPLWAGLIARYAQKRGGPVGFLHPLIYQSAVSAVAFRDVSQGDNDSQGQGGQYQAGPGWDPCTGLGSPIGTALLNALLSASQSAAPVVT
jgi:kumamolisin